MELVGDEPCVGKEALGKALVDVAHVERDDADVLATWDVRERVLELGDGTPIDEFHESLASEVDDHRDEVARPKRLVSAEKVLVEADDIRPRIQSLATLELEMPVECRIEKPCRAAEVATHLLQIDCRARTHGAGLGRSVLCDELLCECRALAR